MLDFTLASQKREMVNSLRSLVQIESVKGEPHNLMPYGKGVFDALMHMMSLADSMYFDSVNLFSHVGYVEYGDGKDLVAVLTHLDVVPAGDGWTYPPFDLTESDGKLYGRGTIDNKGPAIAALYALHAIKENCTTLNKRVRLIFGCDEESGWSDLEFYKNSGEEIPKMAFSPDAEFPIINAEKGLIQFILRIKKFDVPEDAEGVELLSLNGGDRVNVVPNYCECTLKADPEPIYNLITIFNKDVPVNIEIENQDDIITLKCHGVSAHGSKPSSGINAVMYMISFLNTLPLIKNDISEAVYALSKHIGLETDGRTLGLAFTDASGALTVNLGYIKSTEKGVKAGLDIRYPVHMEGRRVMRETLFNLTEFEIDVKFAQPPHYVSDDSALVKGLKLAYEEITGESAYCMSMGGATYARAFSNAVAFGPLFPGQKGTEHQPDEYIEMASFIKLADIIANAIIILCQ